MARPKLTDPQKQNNIKRAASKCFSKHGYAATSIANISKTAKVNPSLIYHYYKNKQELWNAVKEHYIKTSGLNSREEIYACIKQAGTLKEFLEYFVSHRTKLLQKTPELCNLLQWQLADPKQTPSNYSKIWDLINERINKFRKQKEISKDYSNEFVINVIITLPITCVKAENKKLTNIESGNKDLATMLEKLLTQGLKP